jgi:hypothetical protein
VERSRPGHQLFEGCEFEVLHFALLVLGLEYETDGRNNWYYHPASESHNPLVWLDNGRHRFPGSHIEHVVFRELRRWTDITREQMLAALVGRKSKRKVSLLEQPRSFDEM